MKDGSVFYNSRSRFSAPRHLLELIISVLANLSRISTLVSSSALGTARILFCYFLRCDLISIYAQQVKVREDYRRSVIQAALQQKTYP